MDCALSNLRSVGDGEGSDQCPSGWSTVNRQTPFLDKVGTRIGSQFAWGVTSKGEVPDFLVNLGHRQITMDELNKRRSRASRATVPDAERQGGRLKTRWP